MRYLVLPLFLLMGWPAVAQYHYTVTEQCSEAIDLFYKLKLKDAEQILNEEREADPHNLMPVFLMDYVDFFRLYIGEDEMLYYELTEERKKRLKLLEEGPQTSPYYLYCLAEVYLHWAVNRLKFEEYMGAFMNVRKAYRLLERNGQDFPRFTYNQKSLAVLHMVIGSIPGQYKWGADLLGLEGSVKQGMEELQQLVAHCRVEDCHFEEEVRLLEAFLQLHLMKDGRKSWQVVNHPRFLQEDDLLAHFVKASVASYTGRNEAVIEVVASAPSGPRYIEFPFMEYLIGMALTRKLDPAGKAHLKEYATNFNGRNYIKECWQKLGWMCLVEGDTAGYLRHMEKVREEGFAIVDSDIAALHEAESELIPHPLLIKARLLSDGGYHEQALELLRKRSVEDFSALHDQLEFTYRKGRIWQALGKDDTAKRYFFKTLKNAPERSRNYFAPNASLQLAVIFENKGNANRAAYFFNKAIDYKGHAYENGIESQAKAGIKRLER